MRRFLLIVIASLVVAAFAAVPASATSTGTPGQPSQSCGTGPGQSPVGPPGFDKPGFANAESHYADPSRLPDTANGHAVSQYDVACFQLSNH
jgi:hypothetical protein